ncbi:MAG: hypothetical protein ACODAD_00110 [Planctomycetota bacterium]
MGLEMSVELPAGSGSPLWSSWIAWKQPRRIGQESNEYGIRNAVLASVACLPCRECSTRTPQADDALDLSSPRAAAPTGGRAGCEVIRVR